MSTITIGEKVHTCLRYWGVKLANAISNVRELASFATRYKLQQLHPGSLTKTYFGQISSLVICLCCLVGFSSTVNADWLSSQTQADGSIASATDLATPLQSTSEAVRTLRALGRGGEVISSQAYLSSETYNGTEYIARRIIANADAGTSDPSLLVELQTHQNVDGGFGELAGYSSATLDTAFALDAIAATGATNSASAGYGVGFLLQAQRSDGSWANVSGTADVYVTALIARSLVSYRDKFSAVAAAIANADTFLLSKQSADGSWGETFLTAQALLSIASSASDVSIVNQVATALRSSQLSNGSWANDVYSTALAMRALFVFDARRAGAVPTSTGGSISGYVIRAGSNEPLSNATVNLAGITKLSTQTNSDGYFVLNGVPVGDQTVQASKLNFGTASKVVTVHAAQVNVIGTIYLSTDAHTGLIVGSVADSANGLPLQGVLITLSGPLSTTISSKADGSFDAVTLAEGQYAITFHKDGYYDVSGHADITDGSVTDIKQAMLQQGAFQDASPASLSGQVIDAITAQPIASASVIIGTSTVTTASDGTFTSVAIARGEYKLNISAPGYETALYSISFPAGVSGNLGALRLYSVTTSTAPTTLTIVGTVIDSLDNHPLASATILVGGQTLTSDAMGKFTATNLSNLSFTLTASANGHESRTFDGTASGYGETAATFALPPTGGSATATSATINGVVRDVVTNQPIAGARIAVPGTTVTAISGADGSFQVSQISNLSFSLSASAATYSSRSYSIELTQFGTYAIDVSLTPDPNSTNASFQVESFEPAQTGSGSGVQQTFSARVANLLNMVQQATLLVDVVDAAGVTVAKVSPFAPNTQTPTVQFSFDANAAIDVIVPWNPAQLAPGSYRLILHVIQSGSISRDLPGGVVIAQAEAYATVASTQSIGGQLGFNPLLTQAGANTPVSLSAVLVNTGNIPLVGGSFSLSITDPANNQVVYALSKSVTMLAVGNQTTVDFGAWIPTATGNLVVSVKADDATTTGTLTGALYVGDKASGMFTVNKSVVPIGNQSVHATVSLQGVDVRTGTSTDPLFAAVKEAVRKGGLFVGPQAEQWNQTNRCLGCHIQTQSLTGIAAATGKADIDPSTLQYLYNDVAGSLQDNGRLVVAYPDVFPQTQTTLGIWALSGWQDSAQVFRTLYRGSMYQLSRMQTSGNQSYWYADHCSVWLCNNDGQTMTSVKGLAATLRMAQELGSTPVNDYVFDDTGHNFGVRDMLGVQKGPDGWIWYLDSPGQLYAHDLTTGASRQIATGLGNPPVGLAITADGYAYVTSSTNVIKIAPDGTKTVIPVPGSGFLWDIEVAPDGSLYAGDTGGVGKIWHITRSDQVSLFVSGGLLNQPTGMSFDADGTLFVSNYNNWNILKITPTGTVTVFADGLPFKPLWLRRAADGFLYAMTERYNNSGTVPAGIFRIDSKGYVERIPFFDAPNQYGYNSLALIDGEIYVNYGANGATHNLYRMRKITQDTSSLGDMRNALANAARYALVHYQDGSSYNDIHAMHLITLAEARPYISDATLGTQVDNAIAYLADLLRQRQQPDGGWVYINGNTTSSPYATAFIGLALEYTNPSVNDPMVRNSISYLLNQQQADYSWPFTNSPFTTKLGPTSFVMAYMPLALERLGGIDTDLSVTIPLNEQLSNPTITPTTQVTNSDGSVSYKWSLQGVTAKARSIGFDLLLKNMGYNEDRSVASSAYLEFANSFTGEKLKSSIDIPHVYTSQDLALAVATDQSVYSSQTNVAIDAKVTNVGPPVSDAQVHVLVQAADGTILADFGTLAVGSLATNGSVGIPLTWNTGNYLVGNYQVIGQLLSGTGGVIGQSNSSFAISAGTAAITSAITADKPIYNAWDSVALTSRIRNVSTNSIEPSSVAEVTVQGPNGQVIFSGTSNVNELSPSALQDVLNTVKLIDAVSGTYTVNLVVKDAFSRNVLTTASGSFQVNRQDVQAFAGSVTVSNATVSQGATNTCTDTINNVSATAASGVVITQSLVNLNTQAVIDSSSTTLNFSSKQTQIVLQNVATTSLAAGSYGCVLSITYHGNTAQLGSAGFDVIAPPVNIASSMNIGPRGRVLVLVDDDDPRSCSPIKDIELWTPFPTSLPSDATIDVELRDSGDNLIDKESITLGQYRGSVNRSKGKGADLAITGVSADVLTVTIGGSQLGGGYRVIATVNGNSLSSMKVDSGLMGASCGWPVGTGMHFGGFHCSSQHLPSNSHPTPPPAEPTLAQRRAFLERQLKSAGWSYKIVTNEEDFEHEFLTGSYSEYALLAEREKLDDSTQDALREAVNRGAGLVDAGEHDSRQQDLDDALGISPAGQQSKATTLALSNSPLSSGNTIVLQFPYDALRTKLAGATAVGTFPGVSGPYNTAVTTYSYGLGRSVYAGYDLLAEATQGGDGSAEAQLLMNALDYVRPSVATHKTSEVIPLRITLVNHGMAVNGRIVLPMPAGVTVVDMGTATFTNNALSWPYALAVDQTLTSDVWVRLPAQSGTVNFDAVIQTANGSVYVDYGHVTLAVNAMALSTLADPQTLAASNAQFRDVQTWLDKAQYWVSRNRTYFAFNSLLKATDNLLCNHDPQAAVLRLKIDELIWDMGRGL